MALASGLRLGPYEIVSPLGAGGMGEVYRARDTRLDRTVAVKILPSHLASDPQLRERFEREARAVSALDHQNICALYDVGEHEGISFLVMQFLEGETLEVRLTKGPLPLDQALRYGVEIADALDRAHRAGIVHRDLKPGNVMLTKAGSKLLDFGLAKSAGSSVGIAGLSVLPTTPPGLTAQGTILGTLQYMAPEQLEGREADARTDIFAFGLVLFEMVTGRKAFEAKSQASLISAILRDHPSAPSSLQPVAPRALDRLVRICLAKDPDDRWQSARDLQRELAWIAASPAEAANESGESTVTRGRRHTWIGAAIALALLAAAAVLVWLRPLSEAAAIEPVIFEVRTQTERLDDYSSGGFALSPDGLMLAYVDGAGPTYTLYVRSKSALDPRPLVIDTVIQFPFWSPEGNFVAYFAGTSLKKVSISDGTIQTICPLPIPGLAPVHGATWGAAGVILLAQNNRLYRVPATGGTAAPLDFPGVPQGANRWPQFLPDGRRFLYSLLSPLSSGDEDAIYRASLDDGQQQPPAKVMAADYPVLYAEPGYLLFVSERVLYARRFDADTGTLRGEPTVIAPKVAVAPDVNFRSADVAISLSGAVAYRTDRSRSRLTWLDRRGHTLSVIGDADDYVEAELSPDGTQIAVEINEENGLGDIWVLDAVRGTRVPLTKTRDAWEYSPRWSSDGDELAYAAGESIRRRRVDGSGSEETLPAITPPALAFPRQWSRTEGILFTKIRTPGLFRIGKLPNAAHELVTGADSYINGRVSPNGRWLAYTSTEANRRDVYVRPLAGGSRKLISPDGGGQPLWKRDGTELYYQALDGAIMAVAVRGDTLATSPERLFTTRPARDELRQVYSTVDGQGFLVRTPHAAAAPSIVWLDGWRTRFEKSREP